jgi:DNA-binding NarL/FixJ family response regulator
MIRVAMVDDQEMIRLGLRTMIAAQPDLDLVGETADGLAAITLLDTTEADVVLMDLRMPGIDGVEAIRRLRRAHPADTLKIIVLTTFDQDRNVLAALRAGANRFLSKGVGPAELAAGIREVADGGGALSATAAAALIDHVADERATLVDPDMVARFASLTPHEHEIVAAIVSGLDNTRIAAELFLSPFTVKTHANRAMMKVGARDRAQLVSYAVQAGIRP